jgi:hypothetical protein
MRKILYITALLTLPFISQSGHATDGESSILPAEVVNALKTGNAGDLAKFFNSSIELEILGKDAIYSKSQAEMIMKDFFSKNPPSNFINKFEGGHDNSQYAVGTLMTSKGNFRVNFLIKNNLIHQLRIDKE